MKKHNQNPETPEKSSTSAETSGNLSESNNSSEQAPSPSSASSESAIASTATTDTPTSSASKPDSPVSTDTSSSTPAATDTTSIEDSAKTEPANESASSTASSKPAVETPTTSSTSQDSTTEEPTVVPLPEPRVLPALVFPSKRKTITAVPSDHKFNGAHNYQVAPMIYFHDGAVYSKDPDDLIELKFVKKNDDGSWQQGLQSEQVLEVLIDRHHQMQAVFPIDEADHNSFIAHLTAALAILEKRQRERISRGVAGQHVK